ncbi:FHA domain-containing protein [Thiocystis violascens]|uniref:FHA domain-containing protein n=1 Tax=Thiocystis violascens (strain ATCC 17096 / DSM 198 / 6111) TaxID=765911 RepID=I3YAH5_THIV6|nr:FHA domain-containing protein [Thiocystis violascens]AFL73993.1 FHA domain-containing protein [Thiocystis violascens DSM 198]
MNAPPHKFTIGRDAHCDVPLADDSVSARHAELSVSAPGTLLLTDCKSTNGTFLIGADGLARKIRQELVSPLDRARFGAVTLEIRDLLEAFGRRFPDRVAPFLPGVDAVQPWVRGRQLIRCVCGSVKSADAPCPECGR